MEQKYVLRERDNEEIARLKFQHQVWKDQTNFAIEKSRVLEGEKIIDLGCGPGYISYDLLELIGEKGKIFCMDNSDLFVQFIKEQKNNNIEPIKLDIRNELPDYSHLYGTIDKVFCRWVLMFIGDVEKIIEEVYKMLKPGGKFASIEYFNFRQIAMFPKSEVFDKVYDSVWRLITQKGGNPDIGNEVYKIMQTKGFKSIKITPFYKTGKMNSLTWKWLGQTNINHQNLVNAGLITQEELEMFYLDWKEKSENEFSFITAPPLMVAIGGK